MLFRSSVTVKPGKVTLKYDQSARPDGGKLLLALSNEQGARLLAGDPAAIEIGVRGRTADDHVKKLPQFLSILADCNGPEERV